jgi:hypothetical protein
MYILYHTRTNEHAGFVNPSHTTVYVGLWRIRWMRLVSGGTADSVRISCWVELSWVVSVNEEPDSWQQMNVWTSANSTLTGCRHINIRWHFMFTWHMGTGLALPQTIESHFRHLNNRQARETAHISVYQIGNFWQLDSDLKNDNQKILPLAIIL